MGAAILAAYGLGWFKTIESCVEAFIKVDEVFEPNNENHAFMNNTIQFMKLYINKRNSLR